MAPAPLPWSGISNLLKDQDTRKAAERRARRSHIYHHVTARHNTCAHGHEVYLPRVRFGRPGTPAAVGEKGEVSTHTLPPIAPELEALTVPEHLELSPGEVKGSRVYKAQIETVSLELGAGP